MNADVLAKIKAGDTVTVSGAICGCGHSQGVHVAAEVAS